MLKLPKKKLKAGIAALNPVLKKYFMMLTSRSPRYCDLMKILSTFMSWRIALI